MARRGKRGTVDEHKFEVFAEENINQLVEDIIHRRWKPSRSKSFMTDKPVYREIFAAQFRDRLVHHFLYGVVASWWEKQFIYDSYSCRLNKGTDFGVDRMQHFMLKASKNCTQEAYVLKGDLSGFFMSMDRKLLYRKAIAGLKRQFPDRGWLYKTCRYLWREVIFDDPCLGANIVGDKKDWGNLPRNKILFCQEDGFGIVIGNLTSQLLSNIVLNDFDWWMKCTKGFEFYGRYVDDFYVVVPKEQLAYAQNVMHHEAPEKLKKDGFTVHPHKTYEQEVKKGCPFLGKIVRPYVKMPGKRYRQNMKKAFRDYVMGGGSYEAVQSYAGMARHMAAVSAMKAEIAKLEAEIKKLAAGDATNFEPYESH